jgi:hypothetical protein
VVVAVPGRNTRPAPSLDLMRATESPSGRLGPWWPPAGEHSLDLDYES